MAIPLTWGICIPDSCNLAEVGYEVHKLIEIYSDMMPFLTHLQFPVKVTGTTCQPISKKLTTDATAVLYLLAFLVALAIIGSSITAYGYFTNAMSEVPVQLDFGKQMATHATANSEKLPDQVPTLTNKITNGSKISGQWENVESFFKCFCLFTNAEKLFSFRNKNELLCLHGIRFFSFCWIVIHHVFGIIVKRIDNTLEAADILDNWLTQILLNATFAVDSFFLLSGFLLAHNFFKICSMKGGKVSWIYFYIHRYVRLTPVYMLVLGIYATFYYYLGNGPFGVAEELVPFCNTCWPLDMLYIGNFFDTWCMGWAWYLAVDMQFYVISPLFLIAFWRLPKVGYILSAVFIGITFLTNFFISYHYNLFSGMGTIFPITESIENLEQKLDSYLHKIYAKPYTRISPYVIGIALGYFLFQKSQQKRKDMNVFVLGFGWILSSYVGLASVFYLYHKKDSLMMNSVYNGLHHTTYAMALAWLVFICCSEQRGIINSILSCRMYIPLSRLTYSAYLTHVLVAYKYFNGLQVPFHYSHESLVIVFLGLLLEIYAVAFLTHLFLEAPFLRLEEFVMSKLRNRSTSHVA